MNLLLANEHQLFLESLTVVLQDCFDDSKVHPANSWSQVYELLGKKQIDIALLDFQIPGDKSWIEELTTIRKMAPNLPICILSGADYGTNLYTAYRLGVSGYLNKNLGIEAFKKTINLIISGEISLPDELWGEKEKINDSPLTPRQMEVIGFIYSGNSNKEIAEKMQLSEATIKRHLSNIFNTLGVKNRLSALRASQQFIKYH